MDFWTYLPGCLLRGFTSTGWSLLCLGSIRTSNGSIWQLDGVSMFGVDMELKGPYMTLGWGEYISARYGTQMTLSDTWMRWVCFGVKWPSNGSIWHLDEVSMFWVNMNLKWLFLTLGWDEYVRGHYGPQMALSDTWMRWVCFGSIGISNGSMWHLDGVSIFEV